MIFKALWGFFLFSIIASLSALPSNLNAFSRVLDWTGMFSLLVPLEWWLLILSALWGPFFAFFQLLAGVGVVFLALQFFSQGAERVGYLKLVLAFCYLSWLKGLMFLFPNEVGAFIVGIWIVLLGMKMLSWMFRLDSWTSFAVYTASGWVYFFGFLFFGAAATGALIGLLA